LVLFDAVGNEKHQPPLDVRLAELAGRQHAVVSLAQLRALGLTDAGVRARVRRGQLHRLHAGVYAVGHTIVGPKGHWLAGVLACGDGAVLSHRSAAALHGVRPDSRRITDVTVTRNGGRKRPKIASHRCRLDPIDVTRQDGIPVTTVARTLLDLAEVVNLPGVERAIERAEELRIFDLRAVEDVLARAVGRVGAPRLAAALRLDPEMTREELERRFLALCRQAGLPEPLVNVRVLGKEVDFCWPAYGVIVECDSWRYHGGRRSFRRDRATDRKLTLGRWRMLRYTWWDVVNDPDMVVADLRQALASRPGSA
jgi:very-short-patch-repair endonuclease